MSLSFEDYDRSDEGLIDDPVPPIVAPPAPVVGQWSWTPNVLLWCSAGVLMTGFAVWFLMSFTSARTRALAVLEENNGE